MAKPKTLPPAADAAPPSDKETGTMSDLNTSTALGTATVTIDDIAVTLPVRFAAGHTLTDHEAKVIDAAYQRQFKNNQDANAKNRAARLAKADTDEARKENAPWTAAQYAAEYMNAGNSGAPYQPTVGDSVRQSALEKMRNDAAWRFYNAVMLAEHNDDVANGRPSRWFKSTAPLAAPSKPLRDGNGKVTQTVQEQRDATIARLLTVAKFAPGIQLMLEAIQAEAGKGKVAPETVVASADDFAE